MKSPLALFCTSFFLLIALLTLWSCDNNSRKSSHLQVKTDQTLADQLKNRGSYDSAILFFRKAVDYNLKLNQYDDWISSVSGMIDCFRAKGDYDEAMRITEQALAIAVVKIDTTGNLYNGLIHKKALLFTDKRQLDQAAALFRRNINTYIKRSATPDTGLALSYNGMGTVYLYQNKLDEALKEYQTALETYEKSQHTRSANYASSLQNVGIVYSMTGNYENHSKLTRRCCCQLIPNWHPFTSIWEGSTRLCVMMPRPLST
jgi:tetratricopeptide (TPR) repeat protein